MSHFIELFNGTLINLDNVKTVRKNEAVNGGIPSLIITYTDCTVQPLPFEKKHDMECAYRKIKDSNKD